MNRYSAFAFHLKGHFLQEAALTAQDSGQDLPDLSGTPEFPHHIRVMQDKECPEQRRGAANTGDREGGK